MTLTPDLDRRGLDAAAKAISAGENSENVQYVYEQRAQTIAAVAIRAYLAAARHESAETLDPRVLAGAKALNAAGYIIGRIKIAAIVVGALDALDKGEGSRG